MTTSATIPSVSVIMATRGRPENLAQLVPMVLADESVRHFVVVVDGEDDESVALLSSMRPRFDRLVFQQVPRSGQLPALEVGVTLTDADVVLLLDDDVVPTPGLAAAHARGHVGEHGLVLVGTMPVQLPARHADIGSLLYARSYLAHIARIEAGEHDVLDQLWLGNVSIRRSDCLSVGLYSPDFTASYHADQDLGFRLAEAGLVGRFDSSLVAAHRYRRSDPAFLHDSRRRGAGLLHLHSVHERLGPFDPTVFTRDLPAPVAAVVRRIGSSSMAPGVARVFLGLAGALGVVGWGGGRLRLAQVARRIMLFWGATAGEGAVPVSVAQRKVAAPVRRGRSYARSRARDGASQHFAAN
jgi:GT2 family glycosyltransferase